MVKIQGFPKKFFTTSQPQKKTQSFKICKTMETKHKRSVSDSSNKYWQTKVERKGIQGQGQKGYITVIVSTRNLLVRGFV